MATSGVVIRNSQGQVMGASCRTTPHIASSFAAEGTAAVHAIELGTDMGFTHIIIEGDCLAVIEKLKCEKDDVSENGAIIGGQKTFLVT
ncbi:hypothetical protein V6N11_008131 [Hibiscus sabdariffa]|uniref:RNase H type-1 domain-containing protein n=1 Tax=Hibiscus sabdariffa TaxID=183260 RepID=A0ABR2PZW5_9ROSI